VLRSVLLPLLVEEEAQVVSVLLLLLLPLPQVAGLPVIVGEALLAVLALASVVVFDLVSAVG